MNQRNHRLLKMVLLNAAVVVAAVFVYSPGFLGLRLSDESILRAGFSIIAGLGLLGTFFVGNVKLLEKPRPVQLEFKEDTEWSQGNVRLLSESIAAFTNSRVLGSIARTSEGQLERAVKVVERTEEALDKKFEKGSLGWQRYAAVVESAKNAVFTNFYRQASRMQAFDEEDYKRLEHYKEDDIPDEIQEPQIAVYQQELAAFKYRLQVIEQIIYKLNTMSMQLSLDGDDQKEVQELLEEIVQLTDEVKYYRE